MPSTYERIASTVLTGANTITFSSIPQTYTDLVLVVTGFNYATGNAWALRFNADTGNNYSQTQMFTDGSGPGTGSSRNSNLTYGYYGDSVNNNSNVTPNTATVNIFSYTNTNVRKIWNSNSNSNVNGQGYTNLITGLWRSTAAITSIELRNDGGANYAATTVASLYGIKAA